MYSDVASLGADRRYPLRTNSRSESVVTVASRPIYEPSRLTTSSMSLSSSTPSSRSVRVASTDVTAPAGPATADVHG
ncbi:hypothetical protein CP556_24080 [Natrinema sp. CBA1119]|nr:hypothetical protein CP556_24080 [Natrinema sp. CBA1119]